MTDRNKIVLQTDGAFVSLHADLDLAGLEVLERRLKALSNDLFWDKKPAQNELMPDHAALTLPD